MSEAEANADDSAERRTSKREALITDLTYTVIQPVSQSGLIKDISHGGLCLLLGESLPAGTILNVEFDLSGEDGGRIKALVKVMWQKQKDGKFVTGVKFFA